MPDRSSPQGLPDDWSHGSQAARGPSPADAYGTGTAGAHSGRPADAYETGTADAHSGRPADPFGTAASSAYRTASLPARSADGYRAANADPFGDPDPFGEGGLFAPLATDSHGEGAAEARADAEATAAIRPPGPGEAADTKGFLGALFDFGFTSFVTPKVIRVLYMLVTIGTVVTALVFTIIAFKASTAFGVLTLVFGDPLFILIVLAIYRVILEFFVVTFRVAEDIRALRERGGLG